MPTRIASATLSHHRDFDLTHAHRSSSPSPTHIIIMRLSAFVSLAVLGLAGLFVQGAPAADTKDCEGAWCCRDE